MSRASPLTPKERRVTLLFAARTVFAARGYHAASVSDIIETAGVARGTFYNHFESKRDVFAAVLAALMDEIASAVHRIEVTRPIDEQIDANLLRVAQALASAGDAVRILLTDAVSVDKDGEEALAEFYGLVLGRIERALRRGQDLGIVRPGEVKQRARCLLGMVKEPVMQARLAGESLEAEALAAAIGSLLRGGVMTA